MKTTRFLHIYFLHIIGKKAKLTCSNCPKRAMFDEENDNH